jgi:hypothetical protein
MLTRESFFAVPWERTIERVEAPAGVLHVREMNAGEKDAFEIDHVKGDRKDFRARLLVYTACYEDGRPIFSPADVSRISSYSPHLIDPFVRAAARINHMNDEDGEDLRKNSPSQEANSSIG